MAKKNASPSSTAVMARRAPKAVAEAEKETDPQTAIFRTLDYFPTPPWGTRAGAELLMGLDPDAKTVLEPACGAGHMAGVLGEYFEVVASDVYPHGYGAVRDWLDADAWADVPECDWLVTNPPFTLAQDFLTVGLQRARRGVALLLRLAFIEGIERYPLMADGRLTLLAPFSERLPMTLGGWDPEASSATAYAWFFWMKDAPAQPVRLIEPGTKRRLWMPDDARNWGKQTPMPLFEGWTSVPDSGEALEKAAVGHLPGPTASRPAPEEEGASMSPRALAIREPALPLDIGLPTPDATPEEAL